MFYRLFKLFCFLLCIQSLTGRWVTSAPPEVCPSPLSGHPGLTLAPQGLCALGGVCAQACPLCCGVSLGFSRSPEPTVWLGVTVPELFKGWEVTGWEVQVFLFSALSVPALNELNWSPWSARVFWDPTAPQDLPSRELPGAQTLLLQDSLPSSGTSSCPEVLRLFLCHVSILSPTSFQGARLGPLKAWGLQLSSRGCSVGALTHLDELLMCLWEYIKIHRCLTPLPSYSWPFQNSIYF